MVWLIAGIVIVSLVFLAGYRKFALGFVAVAVIGAFLLYQHNEQQQQRADTRIPLSEIVIEQIALKPTFRSSYDVSGRVRNNSEAYRLDGVSLNVTAA